MINKKWAVGAAAAGALLLGACGGSTSDSDTNSRRTQAQGERLIGVVPAEQGGCMWSADADAEGELFAVSATGGKTHISAFNVRSGMKWSKSFGEPYSVVRSDAYTDRLVLAQWFEDPTMTNYGWNTAVLNKKGDVQRFDSRGPDPRAAVDARRDGKRLEIPYGGRSVEMIRADGRRHTVFDAKAFDMSVGAASFLDNDTVVLVGVASKPMFTPAGEIGNASRWVAAARVKLDGEILWAQHIAMSLPTDALLQFAIGSANETVFVTGGAAQTDRNKGLAIPSFVAVMNASGRAKAFRSFENADAPSMVVTSDGLARMVVPFKAASAEWNHRSLRHVIIDSENKELLNAELRGEGVDGFQLRQLMKAGDKAVLAGCFWGATSIGGQGIQSEGDSAFMWLLDPKLP